MYSKEAYDPELYALIEKHIPITEWHEDMQGYVLKWGSQEFNRIAYTGDFDAVMEYYNSFKHDCFIVRYPTGHLGKYKRIQ